jgi:hypothetical protein
MPVGNCFPDASASGGSSTPMVVSDGKKKLLATIDFSAQGSQVFSADGDYTFTTAAGSQVETVTGKWKNLANNTGGSISIAGGKLVANVPTTLTSMFGKYYWSALHAPVLAFDIRQFPDLVADPNLLSSTIIVEGVIDPMFTKAGNVYTSTVGSAYCWAHAGIMQGATAYFAGTQATGPLRYRSAAYRCEASGAGTASNYPYNIFDSTGSAPSGSNAGATIAQFSLNPAPWNSFAIEGITKLGTTWSARHSHDFFGTSTAKFHYYNGTTDNMQGSSSYWQNWDPTLNTATGGYGATSNNDLWAFIGFSRSTGSGTTTVKFSKINIYIVETT